MIRVNKTLSLCWQGFLIHVACPLCCRELCTKPFAENFGPGQHGQGTGECRDVIPLKMYEW